MRLYALTSVKTVCRRSFASELYDLDLPSNFKMMDLACALMERTDLINWMQLEETMLLEPVDRVVVLLEHMSIKHGNRSRIYDKPWQVPTVESNRLEHVHRETVAS